MCLCAQAMSCWLEPSIRYIFIFVHKFFISLNIIRSHACSNLIIKFDSVFCQQFLEEMEKQRRDENDEDEQISFFILNAWWRWQQCDCWSSHAIHREENQIVSLSIEQFDERNKRDYEELNPLQRRISFLFWLMTNDEEFVFPCFHEN